MKIVKNINHIHLHHHYHQHHPQLLLLLPPVQPEKIIETISSKVGEKNTEKIIKPNVRFENKNRRNKTLKKILVGKHGSKVSVLINDNKTRKKLKKKNNH